MKDLYTFDYSVETALKTYEDVREAYSQIFLKEMKLPVLVAKASSGDMGGDLSHEYHIPTALGEDHVMSCDSCEYVANEEVAQSRVPETPETGDPEAVTVWRGITKDRKTFLNVWYIRDGTSPEQINTHAIKQIVPELDSGVEDAVALWSAALASSVDKMRLVNLFDCRVPGSVRHQIISSGKPLVPDELSKYMGRITYAKKSRAHERIDLLRIENGDGCPRCAHGTLTIHKAIELGHTFHLGTRYSEPLNAMVTGPKRLLLGPASEPPTCSSGEPVAAEATTDAEPSSPPPASPISSNENTQVFMQMGCHGIGISRIIGAVANHLVDDRGLNWPRAIAPYEVVIVYNSKDDEITGDVDMVYDTLAEPHQDQQSGPRLDAILDDRDELSMGWKLKDADLVGYPVMVVLGREWKASKRAEVQCRRLEFKELVPVEELRSCLENLLQKL